ncbi:MAG TPA: hypothetical protein PLP26_01870, partial [Ilumatobacteraceae bacterium]|nr:hypothetical protein [Ilumatobacteraceae bacterium]
MARPSAGKRPTSPNLRGRHSVLGRASAAALLVVLAACSGDLAHGPDTTATTVSSSPGSDTTAAEPSTVTEPTDDELPVLDDVTLPDWVPATRTEELNIAISAGSPTVQMAVDAFNLTIGPMPGATPSTLPPGTGTGTHTVRRLIEAARDQLSPDQRAALDALDASAVLVGSIGPDGSETLATQPTQPTDPTTTTPPAGGFRRPQDLDPVSQHYLDLLRQAYLDWKAYRPDFSIPAQELSFLNQASVIADMDSSYPANSEIQGVHGAVCQIRVYPVLWKAP